jgi:hypothetical protein
MMGALDQHNVSNICIPLQHPEIHLLQTEFLMMEEKYFLEHTFVLCGDEEGKTD